MKSRLTNEMTFLNRTFSGTTINVQYMQTVFLGQQPPYVKNALSTRAAGKLLINMSLTGKLETCLRDYVCGKVSTMTPLLAEAANLEKSSPLVAPVLTKLAFASVRQSILLYEFYELMARYDEAERSCARYLARASCN